jgi:hypothetical protein
MGTERAQKTQTQIWLRPLILLATASLSLLLLFILIDYYVVARHAGVSLWDLLVGVQATDAQQVVGGMAEVVVALLGIVITVASIIVQLAATRYTPRITEMYITDRTNLVFLAYFVVTAVYCIWITFSIRAGSALHFFVPVAGVLVLYILLTVAILLMTPYFSYVFYFLDPQNVVSRIRQQTLEQAYRVKHSRDRDLPHLQMKMLDGIEQLSDVALNTLENKDKIIASRSVDALHDLCADYLHHKKELPASWFIVGKLIRQNPDFVAVSKNRLTEISEQKTWVEYKVLRQYQMIYNEALNRMRDLNYLIAIDTRYLGQTALHHRDREAINLCIKFFNTFLRATLNARDVRTAYNVFNQYRQLAEEIIKQDQADLAQEVGNYFRYYAQVAFTMKLSFVTETVAYDLAALIELAQKQCSPCVDDLLDIILEVDKEPEAEEQETSLRGVRKAQIKLATYFLLIGDTKRARRIFEDMREERPDRLRSIRRELLRIDSKDFWEVIDRGENFDYLEPERKQKLEEFFSWFPQEKLHATSAHTADQPKDAATDPTDAESTE